MKFKGFDIVRFKPSQIVSWRIYKDGKFSETCKLRRDAKVRIDFLLDCGVWK